MDVIETDIAVVGAGIAGAGLAAAAAPHARVLLLEAEARPGLHATGRSAAFWSESYGGPGVQPLTTASGPWLAAQGALRPRGCLHVAEAPDDLAALVADLDRGGVAWRPLDAAALHAAVPELRRHYDRAVAEPTCQDIDVARVHQALLAEARHHGARLRCGAPVRALAHEAGGWRIALPDATVRARLVVNAAGAWAGELAALAGAQDFAVQPFRRTVLQLRVEPAPPADLPLVMDARGRFYLKPEAGRLWLSPHDETPAPAHDVAPEEWDQAVAIDALERATSWRVLARERAWAGLRSFAPDRLPVYGFDARAPGFFWCAGQGGFGIQTAPAASALAAALLLGRAAPAEYRHIDVARYDPRRFAA